MSKAVHLARGHCCDSLPHCVFCPYRKPKVHEPMVINPWIAIALGWNINVIIQSDRQSLVSELVMMNRVKIIYQQYQK